MNQKTISIITVNLNGAKYLERTICSVLDQVGAEVEYILIDAGSTDGSENTIGNYIDEIDKVVMAGGLNRPMAINEGLKRATGDWVIWLDSGDVLQPDAFNGLLNRKDKWITGSAGIVDKRGYELGNITSERPTSEASHLMRDSGMIAPGASMWRRSLFTEHGELDATLSHAAEYEWHCRLISQGIYPTVIGRTVTYIRETQAASADQTLQFGEELIHVAQRYVDGLSQEDQSLVKQNLDERGRIYTLAQAEMYPKEARRMLWQQLVRHPWWMTDTAYRTAMVHGVSHPAPRELGRVA